MPINWGSCLEDSRGDFSDPFLKLSLQKRKGYTATETDLAPEFGSHNPHGGSSESLVTLVPRSFGHLRYLHTRASPVQIKVNINL